MLLVGVQIQCLEKFRKDQGRVEWLLLSCRKDGIMMGVDVENTNNTCNSTYLYAFYA